MQRRRRSGPGSRVAIEGAGPGALVSDDDGQVDLSVHLEALSEIDMTHFVVFVNCDMVDSVRVTDPDAVEKFSDTLAVPVVGDSHVVVAAFGSAALPLGLPQYDATVTPRVLTNPIYVDGDGDGASRPRADAPAAMTSASTPRFDRHVLRGVARRRPAPR